MASVAIIGRQNVGKSTLFNCLMGKRQNIVLDKPGVTRDRIERTPSWGNDQLSLVDFPGFEKEKNLKNDPLGQAAVAASLEKIDRYSLLLWVVSKVGLSPYDRELLIKLRRQKNVWLIVNYVDDPSLESEASDFYSLGFETVFFISALNKRNIKQLRHAIQKHFQIPEETASAKIKPQRKKDITDLNPNFIKLAIIGKPNAGKSTLFNWAIKKEKALVSPIAGTTRDSLEDSFSYENVVFQITDTAGLRRKKTTYDQEEFFSSIRTRNAISEADIVWLLISPEEGFDNQNKHLLNFIQEYNKTVVILISKQDQLESDSKEREELEFQIEDNHKMFWQFPYFFVSCLNGKRVTNAIEKSISLHQNLCQKVSTSKLNTMAQKLNSRPLLSGRGCRIKYITQAYPEKKFLAFFNRNPSDNATKRYIKNYFQKELNLQESPIKIIYKKSSSRLKPNTAL